MTTEREENPGPASPGPSSAAFLALAGLLGVAAVVFFVLPRWSATPVVTTVVTTAQPASPSPTPAPLSPAPPEPAPASRPEPVAPPAGRSRPADPSPPPDSSPPPSSSDFDAAVSEALAALDRRDPEAARAAFARAEALRPGTGVVKDGLARSEAALRADALEGHRRRAQSAEAAEDWRGALREYEAALQLEPAVRFALEGAARASARAEASDRLDGYLRRPDRLSTEAVAREAEIALDRASEIASPGPKLLRQIEELRRHLEAAGAAVTVRLLSDERTEVSVLRVGSLGRFREKALELRPGSYVVVGTRPGYRDTRRTLLVTPGRRPEPLMVRCDEAL